MHDNYRNIVVIGASAGGVEAIINVVESIPADLQIAIFIVQHIPSHSESRLDLVINNHTSFEVRKGVDGESIRPGTIYIARADRHLMVEKDKVVVSKGPKENRFRPAVDTLFRSAAHAYRERVIGIVLSGSLNDGTSGMWTINRLGGVSIVQSPEEAMFADMPNGVMQYTDVNHVLPSKEIGEMLGTLCRQPIHPIEKAGVTDEKLLQIELDIAKGKNGLLMGILDHGGRSPLTCPECHGALTQFTEGKLLRYRCHTGHAHTAESLLASVRENVEKSMWEVMRGMEEGNILLDCMAEQLEKFGDANEAKLYREEAKEIQQKAVQVQNIILNETLVEEEHKALAAMKNGFDAIS